MRALIYYAILYNLKYFLCSYFFYITLQLFLRCSHIRSILVFEYKNHVRYLFYLAYVRIKGGICKLIMFNFVFK